MNQDFLGQGLKHPFRFEKRSGSAAVSVSASIEHEHIRESILQILETRPGERLMNPEFGSRVKDLVFEANTDVLKSLLRYYIGKALERWEPRVIVTSISFGKAVDENMLPVLISYRVIRSQVDGNLVYPFKTESR